MKNCPHKSILDNFLYGIKCRLCRHEDYKIYYEKNKENVLKKASEYRKKNPEKIIEIRKKYQIKMSLLNNKEKELTGNQLRYVYKLKSIICKISELEREYNKYCRIA